MIEFKYTQIGTGMPDLVALSQKKRNHFATMMVTHSFTTSSMSQIGPRESINDTISIVESKGPLPIAPSARAVSRRNFLVWY